MVAQPDPMAAPRVPIAAPRDPTVWSANCRRRDRVSLEPAVRCAVVNQRRAPDITIERRFPRPHRKHKEHGRHSDTHDDQDALTGSSRCVTARCFRHRLACRWPLPGARQLRHYKVLIEVDCASVDADLGAPVEPARDGRQVIVFEGFEVALRNLRLVRDLFERETAPFASAPEQLTNPGAVVFVRAGGEEGPLPERSERIVAISVHCLASFVALPG